MSGHTPGPWAIAPFNDDDTERLDIVSEFKTLPGGMLQANWIAECNLQDDSGANLANARLIAAAPDLLDELRNIANADPSKWDLEMQDQFREWAQSRARSAIAKAEGK